jgi:hypothetical protein
MAFHARFARHLFLTLRLPGFSAGLRERQQGQKKSRQQPAENSEKPDVTALEIWNQLIQRMGMSTVAEIKEAVTRLPERQKIQFARWMQTQINDRLSDGEMMEIAAEGARALDRREAHYAKRKAR